MSVKTNAFICRMIAERDAITEAVERDRHECDARQPGWQPSNHLNTLASRLFPSDDSGEGKQLYKEALAEVWATPMGAILDPLITEVWKANLGFLELAGFGMTWLETGDPIRMQEQAEQRLRHFERHSRAIEALSNRLPSLDACVNGQQATEISNGDAAGNVEPPVGRIELIPGGYAVDGKAFNLTGNPLELLRLLLKSHWHRVMVEDLYLDNDERWPDRDSVIEAAKDLKRSMRDAVGGDILTSNGKGVDLAYILDEKKIP